MAAQPSPTPADASPPAPLPTPRPDGPAERPWRTEGVPPGPSPNPGRRWTTMAMWLVGYLLLFGVLTVQDRLSGPEPVAYTDFKKQVADKNVAELFARGDSIEGQLRKAVPAPGQQD
jgi:cell division protease FtsH